MAGENEEETEIRAGDLSPEALLEFMEGMEVPVLGFRTGGEFLFCNRALEALCGYSREEIAESGFMTLVSGEEGDLARAGAAVLSVPDGAGSEVWTLTCRNGEEKRVRVASAGVGGDGVVMATLSPI